MSGVKRIKIGEIDPKLRGEAYLKAVQGALSPDSIASCDPYAGEYDNKE